MKSAIHPEYMSTKVHCNSCNTTFESHSTVPEITVEICSNCHPFYTGKQKLVDTAGRVDRFRARQAAATTKVAKTAKDTNMAEDPKLAEIQSELEDETVEVEQPAVEVEAPEVEPVETAADESTEADTIEASAEPTES